VAPRTSLNRPITPHRRYALGTASLDDVKAVRTAFGVTVNDVVMAACAGGLRRWLQAHGELPGQPLLAMVPISVRTPDQQCTYGNQESAMLAALTTHQDDPVERLRAVHEAMRVAKEQHGAIDAQTILETTQFTMPAVATRAARVAAELRMADWVNPPYNVVI
jgi:WS/DGAT/MGAT family acyltransferase